MSEVKLPETVAYCREWDGDSSDTGNILVEFNEHDLDDGEWTKLCTVQSAEEYAEQRVRKHAKELAALILEEITKETPLCGNLNAVACALIAAGRVRKNEQPFFLYDREEFNKKVEEGYLQHYGTSHL